MSGLQFKRQLLDKIEAGTKTMTRRPIKIGDLGECRLKVGRSYAIQPGRGQLAVGRVTITDVRSERLGAISPDDARREGFARNGVGSTQMFFDYWRELHGNVDEDLLVWVISFAYGHDQLRLLSTPVPGRSGDYTTALGQTIDSEAEAVDEQSQERFTAGAAKHDGLRAQKRRERWEAQTLGARLDHAVERAEREGRDVGRLIARAEAAIKAFERDNKRKAA